ncbi:Helix-turn-helix motif-containing protein [Artemisia annua]|uniref:Homeobox-leucine zipper protein n=1 Tax=Artemisia annua TaxID=35608 RepID=A0A2U1KQB0_ARTAN|nr:Helix-turn-helix motif-containing protein [Artemisia annua]
MEWSSSNPIPFIPRPAQNSFAFLYNCNTDPYLYPSGGAEMKNQMMQQASLPMMEINQLDYENNLDKKKRLSSEQLEALENSFQEEIKLDPDRKMKLAHELGLQPRQVAVWFQNRRARWKAKQLERLYDTLKQEFDAVFREKQKLQDEVLALRTILKEHGCKRQAVSTPVYTDMSGEETVESTPMAAIHSSNNPIASATTDMDADCNYMINYDGATMHTSSYSNWAVLPSYP